MGLRNFNNFLQLLGALAFAVISLPCGSSQEFSLGSEIWSKTLDDSSLYDERNGASIGSIKGMAYDKVRGVYYALPGAVEDTAERRRKLPKEEDQRWKDEELTDPPRFYTAKISKDSFEIEDTTYLKDERERAYQNGDFNPISISYGDDIIYIAYGAGYELRGGISKFHRNGTQIEDLKLPKADGYLQGITISDDGTSLYIYFASWEGTDIKIYEVDIASGEVLEKYIYAAPTVNVTLLAIDDDRMLSVVVDGEEEPHKTSINFIELSTDEIIAAMNEDGRRLPAVEETGTVTATTLTTMEGPDFESVALVESSSNEAMQDLILMSNSQQAQIKVYRARYRRKRGRRYYRERGYGETVRGDEVCTSYCDNYFDFCQAQNSFYTTRDPRGDPNNPSHRDHRGLIAGSEPEIPRSDRDGSSEDESRNFAYQFCIRECMLYPRLSSVTRGEVVDTGRFGSVYSGDTLDCRLGMLNKAAVSRNQGDDAYFCPKAGPSGGGVCSDIEILDKTPYQWVTEGRPKGRTLGYCQVLGEDTIADCSGMITDDNIKTAISLLPPTIVAIILNNNFQLTELKRDAFDQLAGPEFLLAVYVENSGLTKIDNNAFRRLFSLEVLSVANNALKELPGNLFVNNLVLRQVNANGNMIETVPNNLFRDQPFLERINLSGNKIERLPRGFLSDKIFLEILNLSANKLTDNGIPEVEFDALVSLMMLDLAGNELKEAKTRWFSAGWADEYLMSIALNDNDIEKVGDGIFLLARHIEFLYLHDNPKLKLSGLPINLLDTTDDLIAFTL